MAHHCVIIAFICLSTGWGSVSAQPEHPLTPSERSAVFGDAQRLPEVGGGEFVLKLTGLKSETFLQAPFAIAPMRDLVISALLHRLSTEADLAIGQIEVTGVQDGEGRSLLSFWEPPLRKQPYGVRWVIESDRPPNSRQQSLPLSISFDSLPYLPNQIGLLEGRVPIWKVTAWSDVEVPLQPMLEAREVLPGVLVQVVENPQPRRTGVRNASFRLDVWFENRHDEGLFCLPAVTGVNQRESFIGQDDRPISGVTCSEDSKTGDFRSLLRETRGMRLRQWRFARWNDAEWPEGARVRLRVLQEVEPVHLDFALSPIGVTSDLPVPTVPEPPRRVSWSGDTAIELNRAYRISRRGAADRLGFSAGLIWGSREDRVIYGRHPRIDVLTAADGRPLDGKLVALGPTRDWTFDAGQVSGIGQKTGGTGFSLNCVDIPEVIGRIEGEFPIWRVHRTTTHSVPLEATAEPVRLGEGLAVQILEVLEPDEGGRVKVRYSVTDPGWGQVTERIYPRVVTPWFLGEQGTAVGSLRGNGDRIIAISGDGNTYELEASLLVKEYGPFTELVVRVVEEATYEPIRFVATDLPVAARP